MRVLMRLLPLAALAIGAGLAGTQSAEAKGPGYAAPQGAVMVVPVDGRRWDYYDRWERRGPPPGRGWRRDYPAYGYWAPPPRYYYAPPPRVYVAPPPRVWVPAPRYYYAPPPPPGIGLYFRF
ncbi:hypothetical protein [Falsiroseomonas oryziterrae]|uniref:hypothetical protein n=1 Tax=Falsiroseomonas oryziterrae TaxID=2911368 RepID=UPI001F37C79D|nr:hypothetical protein [Roseomonas sp. NPKOSM-4]